MSPRDFARALLTLAGGLVLLTWIAFLRGDADVALVLWFGAVVAVCSGVVVGTRRAA